LNYSILVIARLFALALAPSANFKKQMRLGIGDPGAYAARESGFARGDRRPIERDAGVGDHRERASTRNGGSGVDGSRELV